MVTGLYYAFALSPEGPNPLNIFLFSLIWMPAMLGITVWSYISIIETARGPIFKGL